MDRLRGNRFFVPHLHPVLVANAPSSLPTPDLHANYVWERSQGSQKHMVNKPNLALLSKFRT